jgi:hypothetical protein
MRYILMFVKRRRNYQGNIEDAWSIHPTEERQRLASLDIVGASKS